MPNLKTEIDDLCRELEAEGSSLHVFLSDLQRGKILAALKGYETHPKQDVVMGLFDAMQGLNDRGPEHAAEILKLSNHVGRIFVALNAPEIAPEDETDDLQPPFLVLKELLKAKTEHLATLQREVERLSEERSELKAENTRFKEQLETAKAAEQAAASDGFLLELPFMKLRISENFVGKISEASSQHKDMAKAALAGGFLLANPLAGGVVTLGLYGGTITETIGKLWQTQTSIQRYSSQLSKTSEDTSDPSSVKPSWASDSNTDEHGRWAEFKYKGSVQRLRWCPAGSFLMGSPEDEKERDEDEGPQTEITFKKGFWMFDTPVTQELYRAVMGANPSEFQTGKDAAKRPVETVSWNEAQAFLQRLNEAVPNLSLSLSLPSEAEWEYACRAGTKGQRYANDLHAIFWYGANSNDETHPVAQKAANPWGLYDTLGNVDEWCADVWEDNYKGADPTGLPRRGKSDVSRVVRGGSWDSRARSCRAAYRNWLAPGLRNGSLGFRPIQRASQDK